jgi:hypothetical protein
MINRVSPQEMIRRHQEWERGAGLDGSPSLPRNVRPVLYLVDPFRVPFRGRLWEIPPVPFEEGARVLVLTSWFTEAAVDPAKAVAEYEQRMGEAVALIRRLVRPYGSRLRGLRWRLGLMRNPWRTASHEELGEMLGFFWRRRTMSPDRRLSLQEQAARG